MGKKISVIRFWTLSKPASLLDNINRRLELPNISPPTYRHSQNFIKNVETVGSQGLIN
jgi:hypothetical protein